MISITCWIRCAPGEPGASARWVPAAGAVPAVSVIIVMAVARPAVRIAYRMSPPAPAGLVPCQGGRTSCMINSANTGDVPPVPARQTNQPGHRGTIPGKGVRAGPPRSRTTRTTRSSASSPGAPAPARGARRSLAVTPGSVARAEEQHALRLQPGPGQHDPAHVAGPRAEHADVVRREPGRGAGRRGVVRVARGDRDEDRARLEAAVDPVDGVTAGVGREKRPGS